MDLLRSPIEELAHPSIRIVRFVAGPHSPAMLLAAQSSLPGIDGARRLSTRVTAPLQRRARRSLRSVTTRRHGKIEVALTGGHITTGVVRIGDTVRRPHGTSSLFVEHLLLHLQATGFSGVPRWLGVDEQGRDTFSFLPGRVAAVDEHLTDHQVAAVGVLLRGFHDATRGSALTAGQETVCHHDCGPHNIVFGEDDLPYAMIDFDLAAPGDALEDIAYSAWLCCINSAWLRQAGVSGQAKQLRCLTDSYGLPRRRRHHLLDAVGKCQLESIRWAKQCLAEHTASSDIRKHAARTLVGCRREHRFLLANRVTFERALR